MVLCLPFLIKLEFGKVGFCGEGKTGISGEKPLEAKERTNNKLNSPTKPPLVGDECSRHCATIAPPTMKHFLSYPYEKSMFTLHLQPKITQGWDM